MTDSRQTLPRSLPLALLVSALLAVTACSTSKSAEADSSQTDEEQQTTTQTQAQTEEDEPSEDEPSEDKAGKNHGHGHAHKGPRGHRFEHPERYADRWNDPKRDAWQKPEAVIDMLGVGPKEVVADLGTGTGYFLPHLSEAVGPKGVVYGLDISENMVEFTRKQVDDKNLENVKVEQVSPDSPALDDVTYHRLLTVNTWHHIHDRPAYAKKLYEAIRPGGAVLIVDYTMDADQGPPKRMRLKPEQVVRELEAGGFEAEHLEEESLPKQYVVKGFKQEPSGD